MENNENFVEQTENVEQTTEETVVEPAKVFTQEDMNAAVGKAKARVSAKIRKEFEKEYGDLVDVLEAGTGKRNVGEITDALKQFYASKGVSLPEKKHDNRDLEVLARADAEEIISGGYDEVVEEVDRLANKANMTAREKATFKVLAEYRTNAERGKELAEKGVSEDVYNSKEFKEYAGMFKSDIPIGVIYDNYQKMQPKKEIRTMGSMKNNSADNGVKEYYSPEEAKRFTQAEINNNPALFAAIERSMQKWK